MKSRTFSQLSFFSEPQKMPMKRFEAREIKEAIAYAKAGGQALHVWEPHSYRFKKGIPNVFRDSELWAHLFDNDRERLVETARRLKVRVIVVDRDGRSGQHVDLCMGPLKRAIAMCVEDG